MNLWERVDRSGGLDACWPFRGAKTKKGYGSIRVGKRTMHAHRLAFTLDQGREPDGQVRHSCDNPPCCNPRHLLEGSDADNKRDMVERGRRKGKCLGEENGRAKLTPEKAAEIRARHASGESINALSAAFGVAWPQVKKVVTGERWA